MRRVTLSLAVVAVLLLALAGPGVRAGFWTFGTGFHLLRWGAYLGIAAAVLAVIQLLRPAWRAPTPWPLLAAVVLGLIAAGVPWYWLQRAERVPPIHDITTDTRRPPEFVAVLPLRAGAANPATYGGPDLEVAFNPAYLIDGVEAITSDEVVL